MNEGRSALQVLEMEIFYWQYAIDQKEKILNDEWKIEKKKNKAFDIHGLSGSLKRNPLTLWIPPYPLDCCVR